MFFNFYYFIMFLFKKKKYKSKIIFKSFATENFQRNQR